MGQYGNQPDFGTRAKTTTPYGYAIDGSSEVPSAYQLKSAALYVGTGGNLLVRIVGGDSGIGNIQGNTLFKNIPDGTFLPVVVDFVWQGWDTDQPNLDTTCSDIVALY